MQRVLLVSLMLIQLSFLMAQSVHYDRDDRFVNWIIRAQSINPQADNIHLALRNVLRKDAVQRVTNDSLYDDYLAQKISLDNPEYTKKLADNIWSEKYAWANFFFKRKAQFLSLEKPGFKVYVNPIANLKLGAEKDNEFLIFQNTRGFELSALIDEKVYFYTSLFENQTRFPSYIDRAARKAKTVPGQGFYKSYTSTFSDKIKGFDYLNAVAYFGVPISKNINIELGHGNHFIGHGYHSLLLSDYAHNYFYLKLNTNIWKFHYQNIFAELTPLSTKLSPVGLIPKKYMAAHYLSYKPTKRLEIGLFETVVFGRENNFEFQYLNPIIFYRTVEQFIDSPDNIMIGLNGRWDAIKGLSLYAQWMIDEFKVGEFFAADQWWGNKYGIQAGLLYANVATVNKLDLRLEFNRVRPYMYSHFIPLNELDTQATASYSHHGQPLAHPLGANFTEYLLQLNYIKEKWSLELLLSTVTSGVNSSSINYGSDILLLNTTRIDDYGIDHLQGIGETINHIGLDISYELFHNVFLDLHLLNHSIRRESSETNAQYIGGGFRMNVSNYRIEY